MLNAKLTDQKLENARRACELVQKFIIAGECPIGVRPIVMNALADIIALTPRTLKFSPPIYTRRIHGYGFDCLTTDEVFAARMKRRGYSVEAI